MSIFVVSARYTVSIASRIVENAGSLYFWIRAFASSALRCIRQQRPQDAENAFG
jgi:hypothetical protein